MAGALWYVLSAMLADWSTFGFHDWDVMSAYRYITVLSLKEYGEGPWWHPWLCGGFPAFGHFEGASNLVSPYLPVYLIADIQHAIRIDAPLLRARADGPHRPLGVLQWGRVPIAVYWQAVLQ